MYLVNSRVIKDVRFGVLHAVRVMIDSCFKFGLIDGFKLYLE